MNERERLANAVREAHGAVGTGQGYEDIPIGFRRWYRIADLILAERAAAEAQGKTGDAGKALLAELNALRECVHLFKKRRTIAPTDDSFRCSHAGWASRDARVDCEECAALARVDKARCPVGGHDAVRP